MTHQLTITKPDDWHVHFRDDEMLIHTVPATAQHFARALVMPNLKTPLTTLPSLLEYRQRILNISDQSSAFMPYMTFYLNEHFSPDTLIHAQPYSFVLGGKLYPAGVTTHSQQGARSIKALYPIFEVMQSQQYTLQIHGEYPNADIFDRETQFLKTYLRPIIQNFPKLPIVLEHISTKAAVDFVLDASSFVAATITPHHLMYNRNHLLSGGIKPHYYCLPILKRETDQHALITAATSGNRKFFAGTDSAPHPQTDKESACGCAGIYSAPYALALYTEIFEKANRLTHLNSFLSRWGSEFYQLPRSQNEIMLVKKPMRIANTLPLGSHTVIPIAAGEVVSWCVHE